MNAKWDLNHHHSLLFDAAISDMVLFQLDAKTGGHFHVLCNESRPI